MWMRWSLGRGTFEVGFVGWTVSQALQITIGG